MKFEAAVEKKSKAPEQAPETVVHPFVQALENMAALVGRDLGVISLRAIEAQKSGPGAVLFWTEDRVPPSIKSMMHGTMLENLAGAMLVPQDTKGPSITFDFPVRMASRTLADGSSLLVFEKLVTENAAGE